MSLFLLSGASGGAETYPSESQPAGTIGSLFALDGAGAPVPKYVPPRRRPGGAASSVASGLAEDSRRRLHDEIVVNKACEERSLRKVLGESSRAASKQVIEHRIAKLHGDREQLKGLGAEREQGRQYSVRYHRDVEAGYSRKTNKGTMHTPARICSLAVVQSMCAHSLCTAVLKALW